VVAAAPCAHVLYVTPRYCGLFCLAGLDLGIDRSTADAVLADGSRAFYDPDSVISYARELARYHGLNSRGTISEPGCDAGVCRLAIGQPMQDPGVVRSFIAQTELTLEKT